MACLSCCVHDASSTRSVFCSYVQMPCWLGGRPALLVRSVNGRCVLQRLSHLLCLCVGRAAGWDQAHAMRKPMRNLWAPVATEQHHKLTQSKPGMWQESIVALIPRLPPEKGAYHLRPMGTSHLECERVSCTCSVYTTRVVGRLLDVWCTTSQAAT